MSYSIFKVSQDKPVEALKEDYAETGSITASDLASAIDTIQSIKKFIDVGLLKKSFNDGLTVGESIDLITKMKSKLGRMF